jgi:hypothetical protein
VKESRVLVVVDKEPASTGGGGYRCPCSVLYSPSCREH